jgi:GNAT superfamily N-acetyltransferase
MNINKRDVLIRRIEDNDFSVIEAMEEIAGNDDMLIVEELSPMFNQKSDIVEYMGWIAEYQGELQGYLIAFRIKKLSYLTAVVRCVVDINAQRNGIGSLLMAKVEPEEQGHKTTIECDDEGYAALSFLASLGYIVTQAIEPEYDLDGEKAWNGSFVLTKEKRQVLELKNRLAMYPYHGE